MKTPLANERITEEGPGRLVIRSGGGCLSVFGFPFFAAGICAILVGLGFIELENAAEVEWWTWPVLLAMGAVFTAVGGGLMFGRRWISLERSRGVIERAWGLLVPLRYEEIPMQLYSTVSLRFDPGDSDSPDRYPVVLDPRGGGKELPLMSCGDYAAGRAGAERIASFLSMPLVDSTSDHQTVHDADAVAAPFRERARRDLPSRVQRPASLRTSVEQSARSVRFRIPGPGFRHSQLLRLVIPLGIGGFVATQMVPFFHRSDTPGEVQWFFLGFLALIVLGPAAGVLLSGVRNSGRRTVVSASPQGITIQDLALLGSKTTEIGADDLIDIDFSTAGSRLKAARRGGTTAWSGRRGEVPEGMHTPRSVPRWIQLLGALVPSSGVILKTRKGVFSFGAGLPDEEVEYLHDLLRRTLLD
jgi:hypothetical protein